MGTTVSVRLEPGASLCQVYVAEPQGPAAAAVVVGHEIYGLNADIRHKCDLWAERGFLAVAPDFFWRLEPGVDLDPYEPTIMDHALALARRFDTDAGVRDVQATLDNVRAMTPAGTRVGLIGYSLGARLAALAAIRTDVDTAIGYYGVRLSMMLPEAAALRAPLMLHFAGRDRHVPTETHAELHDRLDGHPLVTIHDYPGAGHDFAYGAGPLRSPVEADLADARTLAFIQV